MVGLAYILKCVVGIGVGLNIASASEVSEGRDIARKNLCLGCHAETKKVVGPAFMEIAKRYDSSPASYTYLSRRIKEGGVGVWGAIPMPANKNNITDKEVNLVIQWIFSLRR
jgi:cytochrome c